MTDSERSLAGKTVAHATIEELITPKLEPGKACLVVIRGRSVGRLYELGSGPALLGRSADVELTIEDTAVSRRHARIEPAPEGYVLTDLKSTNGVFVNGVRIERHVLKDRDRVQIGTTTLLKFCFADEVEASFQQKLYDSATRDPLAGTYNRKFFLETLDLDFGYCIRNDTPLTVLMIDLDFFKAVNDTYGHLAGDQVLREMGALIQKDLRTEDILARYGGEEFAVILRYTEAQRAQAIAERLRRSIEGHSFDYEGQKIQLTVSIGVATLAGRNYETPKDLLRTADEFLYKAKELGRNRTIFVAPFPEGEAYLSGDTLNLRKDDVLALARASTESPLPEEPALIKDKKKPAKKRGKKKR